MKRRILSLDVDVINLEDATEHVLSISENGGYVCVANVHMIMEAFDNEEFSTVVNSADLVVPDGKPLSVYQKFMGDKSAELYHHFHHRTLCLNLLSMLRSLMNRTNPSLEPVLHKLKGKLSRETNGKVNISFSYSPPFRKLTHDEITKVISMIQACKVDILFVGIGCPKQENWMYENSKKLNCALVGIGAVFDFVSGVKKEAPKFVYSMGFEWLFRLLSEPRRLWRRYLIHNTRFLFFIFYEFIKNKIGKYL